MCKVQHTNVESKLFPTALTPQPHFLGATSFYGSDIFLMKRIIVSWICHTVTLIHAHWTIFIDVVQYPELALAQV